MSALLLSGCSELDALRLRLARQTPTPQAAPTSTVDRVRTCGSSYSREATPPGKDDLRIGVALFFGLAKPRAPWWYQRGRVIARHLRRGEFKEWRFADQRDIAKEVLANGPDLWTPDSTVVGIPPETTVTVSIPQGEVNAGLLPAPPQRFGGFAPHDGVKRITCKAEGPAPGYDHAFNIAFIVAGPRCVPVTVTAHGRSVTREVRFGVDRC